MIHLYKVRGKGILPRSNPDNREVAGFHKASLKSHRTVVIFQTWPSIRHERFVETYP